MLLLMSCLSSNQTILVLFVTVVFWPRSMYCGILIPQPGIDLGPWGSENSRVLTTGLPGSSQELFNIIFSNIYASPLSVFSSVTPSVTIGCTGDAPYFYPCVSVVLSYLVEDRL